MANILKALGRTRAGIDIPPVVVIGLGRFGSSLAHELMANGVEVLGIDSSEKRVREEAPYLTETIAADTTDPEALRQLGVEEVERVIVAIGNQAPKATMKAADR